MKSYYIDDHMIIPFSKVKGVAIRGDCINIFMDYDGEYTAFGTSGASAKKFIEEYVQYLETLQY